MRNKIALTINRINSVEPQTKRTFIYDTKIPGLRLQITPAGTKTFQFYGRPKNSDPVTITIGRWPKVSLDIARKKASRLAGEISLHGKKVVEDLREEKNELTFSDLFESWFKDQKIMGKRDLNNVRSRYNSHLYPTIGSKRLSVLDEKFLTKWFLNLPKRKKVQGIGTISNSTANRCLEIVSAVLGMKAARNPTVSIKNFPEESRERYLSGGELARLFKALDHPETGETLRDIVLLALTTGARKMNILSMRWVDLDLENAMWVIPATLSKNNKSMGVPLIPEAVGLLKRRKKLTHSVFVFPAKGKTGHLVDIKRSFTSLLKRAAIEDFVFHDLRRTLGSWQAHTGASDLIIGKSLGHSSTQSTRIYARIRDNNPIRESMDKGFAAMKKASSKVVNLQTRE